MFESSVFLFKAYIYIKYYYVILLCYIFMLYYVILSTLHYIT